jgi:hypothetical protein
LQIVIFMFLDNRQEDKRFCTKWQQAIPKFNLLLISSWIKFWSLVVVFKCLNCTTFSKDLLAVHLSK